MKEMFNIEGPDSIGKDALLSIRLGKNHVGFAITDNQGKKLQRLAYYNFDDWNASVEEKLIPLQALGNKIIVGYDFYPSVLVNSKDLEENSYSDLLHYSGGPAEDSIALEDSITAYRLRNIYAVPAALHQWVIEKFPAAEFIHDYSIAIKSIKAGDHPAELYVDFRAGDFTVIVWKEKKFIQAASYPYVNPADVLYYLLRICQSLSLSQSTTQLTLSGFLDQQSTLYTQLFQYFLPLSFSPNGWITSSAHPPHFFRSFQNLAACAS